MPLNTRAGSAEAPIEPGARTLCEPCETGPRGRGAEGGARLDPGHALHVTVLGVEDLRHSELSSEEASHNALRSAGFGCRRRPADGRAAGASRPSWGLVEGCR